MFGERNALSRLRCIVDCNSAGPAAHAIQLATKEAVLKLMGLQLVALGLVSELKVRQYFNPTARRPYAVSEVLDSRANRPRW